jgi:hypothetical protein
MPVFSGDFHEGGEELTLSDSMKDMFKKGLEFAHGTSDVCKKTIRSTFSPSEIFTAYRAGRVKFRTGDLVLVTSDEAPNEFDVCTRTEYVNRLKQQFGRVPVLAQVLVDKSAHEMARLPFESDALWLVVASSKMPNMCAIFSTPYEVTAIAN